MNTNVHPIQEVHENLVIIKSDRERKIPYDTCGILKKNNKNELIYKTEIDTQT